MTTAAAQSKNRLSAILAAKDRVPCIGGLSCSRTVTMRGAAADAPAHNYCDDSRLVQSVR
jgi:hypothetical protein